MSRRRRHTGTSRPRCRNCRAWVRFFRDLEGRWQIVNEAPVNGHQMHDVRGSYPEWGGRLWPDVDELAAELSTKRPPGTDVVDEVLDLPWYQLHHCQLSTAIAERREASHA